MALVAWDCWLAFWQSCIFKEANLIAACFLVIERRDYLLMATHEQGRWVFNPTDDHIIKGGTALVLMTSPDGLSTWRHYSRCAPWLKGKLSFS